MPDGFRRTRFVDNHDHADATIESAPHFRDFDLAGLSQPVKDGSSRPAAGVDLSVQRPVKYARNILGDTAACNVSKDFHGHSLYKRHDRFDVNACWRQQDFAGGTPFDLGVGCALEYLPD